MFQRPRRDSGNRSREATSSSSSTGAPTDTASASPSLPPAMPPALPLARVATTHSTADSASTRAKRTGLLARFSWRKLKAGITGGQHTVAKESSTARVVVSAPLTAAPIHESSHGLSPVREVSTPPIPIPGSGGSGDDFNSTVVASTPPVGGGALVYKTLFKGAPGDDSASVSTATLTATADQSASSKPAAHGEVAILAMIAAAKDANTDPSRTADWTHVVSPRDVLVDDVGRDVVVFDAYTHLNLSDVPLRTAADLVRQLLSALDAIHALGIVHLDVNPANLMQDAVGRLVLIDFGLARASRRSRSAANRSSASAMTGNTTRTTPMAALRTMYDTGGIYSLYRALMTLQAHLYLICAPFLLNLPIYSSYELRSLVTFVYIDLTLSEEAYLILYAFAATFLATGSIMHFIPDHAVLVTFGSWFARTGTEIFTVTRTVLMIPAIRFLASIWHCRLDEHGSGVVLVRGRTPPIPIPGSGGSGDDFNSTVVASTPPVGGGALVYKTLFKGAPGDDSASVSTATLTATADQSASSKPAAHGEVAILAMIAAAKDANTDPSRTADWTHVVSPRDVLVDDVGRDVVVFDAYTHLNLSDVPLRTAADLVRQLLSALDAIHALGIVHLDVNPANLMQDAVGRLVLIDFGLARVCDGTPHPPGRGTRGYIAPELFPPKMCTSTYPDLYSAGIVFGQLLEPYLAHCNLRILGGSASYPVHVEEVWQDVREFVEIEYVLPSITSRSTFLTRICD
ncbi:serine/threonine protein kinase [Allomyces macrogynus ATCC 38327]|uniref:Serine/threonine protein kinase n=1 Tax=Allomyces macrogynus (strain ATCC 38327) TaxID=578462 RepID=A0A0L0TCE3_ALLM3|nr:serine/threonine protein kinase [Allomyces macrogynus ATCC 38327]|eukprot:KNE72478.1 serine/threonine protein kinase [Allomyces macrogynus ATCC 38327]